MNFYVKHFLFVLLALAGSAVYGMQEQKVAQAAQQENKEAKAKTFEEQLKEEEENRIQKKYEDFHAAAQKFLKERYAQSPKLDWKVQQVVDSGFVQQAKLLGRTVLWREDETIKMNAERRMNTLIAFGKYLFSMPVAENERIERICGVMNTWLVYASQDTSMRQFDGMGLDLWINHYGQDKKPLLDKQTTEKLADAFYGWSWI